MISGKFEELAVGDEAARLYMSGSGGATPGVVVFHPWWGLNDDVIAYADRLAAAGFSVVAPDLVRVAASNTASRVGAVGFSMGVAWAMWSATQRPAVAASVVYYGTFNGPGLARASVPVLGHFAEADLREHLAPGRRAT